MTDLRWNRAGNFVVPDWTEEWFTKHDEC
jgi:hypothetical protein